MEMNNEWTYSILEYDVWSMKYYKVLKINWLHMMIKSS